MLKLSFGNSPEKFVWTEPDSTVLSQRNRVIPVIWALVFRHGCAWKVYNTLSFTLSFRPCFCGCPRHTLSLFWREQQNNRFPHVALVFVCLELQSVDKGLRELRDELNRLYQSLHALLRPLWWGHTAFYTSPCFPLLLSFKLAQAILKVSLPKVLLVSWNDRWLRCSWTFIPCGEVEGQWRSSAWFSLPIN